MRFTKLSLFRPLETPVPSALALLACVNPAGLRVCAVQEGPASTLKGLRCPYVVLTGPASALRGSYCLCAALAGLWLDCIAPGSLCAGLECCFSALVVLLAWDQTIPLANIAPRCNLNTSEILSKPRPRILA